MKIGKRGFLLLEVIISVAVITTGLLFVMRSYGSSRNSVRRSGQFFETSLLLEEKLWEYEAEGEIAEGVLEGDFEENEEYSWKIGAKRMENSDLNLVTLEVFRKKDPQNTKHSLSLYIRNKTE